MRKFIILLCLFISQPAWAKNIFTTQDPRWLLINEKTNFIVTYKDNVADGCWENPRQTRDMVASELSKNGLTILNDIGKVYENLYVNVDAYGGVVHEANCLVSLSLKIRYYYYSTKFIGSEAVDYPAQITLYEDETSIIVGKNLKDVIEENIQGQFKLMANNFVKYIPQAKQRVSRDVIDRNKELSFEQQLFFDLLGN